MYATLAGAAVTLGAGVVAFGVTVAGDSDRELTLVAVGVVVGGAAGVLNEICAGTEVGVRSPRSGVSLRSAGTAGAVAGVVGRKTGAVSVESPLLNGFSSTSAINAAGTAMIASVVSLRGPPYLPIGPRTARPYSSTQNTQRSGAFGHDLGGCHRRGGRQSGVGGSGHSGGVLNCRTFRPPRRAA
ncbi:hypothetical protein [Kribbella sp. NPDC000426]|uniref:hypothetical protein n=1 Tax=Kribbella sp. NPDC000426 TaxID=3154255 RepID=UPI00332F128B